MIAIQITCWLVVAYMVTSLLEYVPHRWVMHSRGLARRMGSARLAEEFEAHATLHHGRYFAPGSFSRCTDPAARYISIDIGALYMAGKTIWIWLPVALYSHIGAVVLVAFFATHGAVWTAVHREMHYPRGRRFARTAAYRFWHRYHEMHHERHGTNFNVLCPLADWLFGTYGGLA